MMLVKSYNLEVSKIADKLKTVKFVTSLFFIQLVPKKVH